MMKFLSATVLLIVLAVSGACSGSSDNRLASNSSDNPSLPLPPPPTTTEPTTTTTMTPTTLPPIPAVPALTPLMTYCIQQANALYARYPSMAVGKDPVARCESILTNENYPVVDRAGVDDLILSSEELFKLATAPPVSPPPTTPLPAPPTTTTTTSRRQYCSAYYTIPGQSGPLHNGAYEDRVFSTNGSLSSSACQPAPEGTWVPKDESWVYSGSGCCFQES